MSSHRWLSRRLCPGTALLVVAAAAALASGCASPEVPAARHVIIPQTVQDVQARQQGTSVVLSFTLPNQSTQKEPLAEPPAVEIYRGEVAAGATAKAAAKTGMKPIYTIPSEMVDTYRDQGKIVYRDTVDAATLARPRGTVEWVYVVRTRVARSRASADSNRVVLPIEPPPPPVAGLRARLMKANGEPPSMTVILEWPREAGGVFYIFRAELTANSASSSQAESSRSEAQTPLLKVGEVRLQGSAGDLLAQYRDSKVEIGHTYSYIVRRADEYISFFPVVESADSNPAIVTVAEAQPPKVPEDVQALAVAATATEPPYVSLSWTIGAEAGVAGYAVYRSAQEGVRGVRLNDELLGAPTYQDASAAAGQRYFYSVTAVAGSGLESAPSPAVEAQIPTGQP
jgi:hypothetical protein